MSSDLASASDGIAAPFVPEQDPDPLIEAEHVCRYQWAAQAAGGRRVLDAGCGTGYGCRLLADAGARQVIGVDVAESVLGAVPGGMPESVRLRVGDVRKLEFEDDTFDLIVCFEVVEHLEDPVAALDELVRVLAPGGLLLTSSSAQPETELAARLGNVRRLQQQDYMVSAVLSNGQADGAAIDDLVVRRPIADAPRDQVNTIIMASDAALPDLSQLATMTGARELREWRSAFETIADRDSQIDELTARLEERDQLAQLLGEAEARLADVPQLNLRIADLEFELAEARSDLAAARREVYELDRALIYGRRMLRFVRPLIKPLRRLRRKLRG